MKPSKLLTVPARQGSVWVRQGFRVFFRQPMVYTGLFAIFLFVMFVLRLLPVIGPVLLLALLPLVTLAFMVATRLVVEGLRPSLASVRQALRMNRPQAIAMFKLGVIYAAATLVVLTVSDFVDGGAFDAFVASLPTIQTAPDTVAAKLSDPRLALGMLMLTTLLSLLSAPFWHAPALVFWGGQACGQALFSSTLACWRNRSAFVIYMLTWVAAVMLFTMLGSLVFALLGQVQLFAVASTPFTLLLMTVYYASLYFTFADCFVAPPAAPAPEPPP
jgi:hypothetical protein